MSFDYFHRQRRAHRPQAPEPEAEPFQIGQLPGWATAGTAAYEAIDRALLGVDRTPPVAMQPVEGAAPLPKRSDQLGRWRSQRGEPLDAGDEVALSLAEHPGAKGRIIGEMDDEGTVVCELTECGSSVFCQAVGRRVRVDAEHFLMLIAKGGDQ